MRYLLIAVLITITAALVGLALADNVWLWAGLLALVVGLAIATYTLAAVMLGGKIYRDAMSRGADIVLKGQQINDDWDARKMSALAQFGRETIRLGHDGFSQQQQYPMLPPMDDFTIAGLLDEETN